MKAYNKSSKDKLNLELNSLADLALKDLGIQYSVDEAGDVLAMLKWASQQDDVHIRRLLPRIGKCLNPGYHRFFESNGVSFTIFPRATDNTVDANDRFSHVNSVSAKIG